MARVLAAFRSLFESAAIFFLLDIGGLGDASIVGGSGSKPLWYEVFSGDVFVELTVVKAVVVSEICIRLVFSLFLDNKSQEPFSVSAFCMAF